MNRTQMFSLLRLYHNKTFWLYTEHEQNTDVQSLETISQQNILTVHRTWTEHRCSVSSLWLHQSSSCFLRMRWLSCHCAESGSFIMNPNKHSPPWEAHKYSASQEIPCINVIWRYIIKFQRAVHSTRSDSQCACFLQKSYRSCKMECYLLTFFTDCVFCDRACSFSALTSTNFRRSWSCSFVACSFNCFTWSTRSCTSLVRTLYNTSSCSLLPYSVETGNLKTNAGHLLT